MPVRASLLLKTGLAALALAPLSTGALAQREIVQALPPPEAAELNSALQRLARSPTDTAALIQAGEASLALGDHDAAMGFFVRARDLSPRNPRAVTGLARSFLAQGRAVEALRFFAEAERVGAPAASIAADRGLATDLVGDTTNAQAYYRLALEREDTPETRRRLALSQAISGDRTGFEATLLPLLRAEDRAAFRTRSFGLAILGDDDEAIEIAESMMPADMALRMAPYLRYMPRLTKAQQAAAANMGTFPRTSDIGRDSPEVAGYSPESVQVARTADASLTPTGPTLGSETRRTAQAEDTAAASRGRPDRQAPRSRSSISSDPLARTRLRTETVRQPAAQPPVPAPEPAAQDVAAREPQPQPQVQPQEQPQPQAQPVQVAAIPARPSITGFSLPASGTAARPATPAATPEAQEPEPKAPASLADAFADFGTATPAGPAAGAVDITAIEPPREVEAPPPPAHPARHWVQVATGRDRSALAFDWRRIARRSESLLDGKGPFVTPWGVANRLLAGPYDSAAQAREIVSKLKALDVDSFTFTSAQGEAVERLD